jgi:hypothetical protein
MVRKTLTMPSETRLAASLPCGFPDAVLGTHSCLIRLSVHSRRRNWPRWVIVCRCARDMITAKTVRSGVEACIPALLKGVSRV